MFPHTYGSCKVLRKVFLIYEEMRKYLTIYEEAVSHIWLCNLSLYMRKILFYFLSVCPKSSTKLYFHEFGLWYELCKLSLLFLAYVVWVMSMSVSILSPCLLTYCIQYFTVVTVVSVFCCLPVGVWYTRTTP